MFVSTTGTLVKTFHPFVDLRLDPRNGKPAKHKSKQTVSNFAIVESNKEVTFQSGHLYHTIRY